MTDPHYNRVPAIGPKDADIYLVGESPGRQEAYNGVPFYPEAQAGSELTDWLSKTGLSRSDVRINNALKYWPKGDKSEWFFQGGQRGKPTQRFEKGIVELAEDIMEVDPNVVVPMGNYALWALVGEWGIQSWRGSILEAVLVDDQKIIPTLHPAFIKRAYKKKPLALWDFKRIKEESKTSEINLPERDYTLHPSPLDVREATERLLEGDHFTYDTEWNTPESLACISFTNDPSWAICIPADVDGAFEAYRKLLSSDLVKICQNAMFDVVYMRKAGFPVKCAKRLGGDDLQDPFQDVDEILSHSQQTRIQEDTMVGHHVCWPDIQNRLERLTSIYTREPYYKEEFDVWQNRGGASRLYEYNCKDSAVTEEIMDALQSSEMPYCSTERAYQLNMLTFDIMSRATEKGIRADWAKLQELRQENIRKRDELKEALKGVTGYDLNVKSYPQVFEFVYDYLGFRERKRSPTGQDTLMDLAAQCKDETKEILLATIIKIRKHRQENSRYIHPCLVDTDGRIRCSWNMAGTKNGRLSSSKDQFKDCDADVPGNFKGRGAPLQTIPYKARQIFIPDPGHVFIAPDLAQAEARVVAYLSEDHKVLDWIDEGKDIHKMLASLMFDMEYDSIIKGERPRYLAKTCRHALNYKMGPDQFKREINEEYAETGFGVTAAEAKELRNRYLSIHSPLKMWWKKVKRDLGGSKNQLTSPLGRTRRFIGRWGDRLIRDAIAFLPQSTIGDLTHLGLYEVDRCLPYADVLINIHDGSLIQVPEDKVDEAAQVIKEALTIPITVNGYEVEIPVEVEVGYNWKDTEEVEVD